MRALTRVISHNQKWRLRYHQLPQLPQNQQTLPLKVLLYYQFSKHLRTRILLSQVRNQLTLLYISLLSATVIAIFIRLWLYYVLVIVVFDLVVVGLTAVGPEWMIWFDYGFLIVLFTAVGVLGVAGLVVDIVGFLFFLFVFLVVGVLLFGLGFAVFLTQVVEVFYYIFFIVLFITFILFLTALLTYCFLHQIQLMSVQIAQKVIWNVYLQQIPKQSHLQRLPRCRHRPLSLYTLIKFLQSFLNRRFVIEYHLILVHIKALYLCR